MLLTRSDYWLARFCFRFAGLMNRLSAAENLFLVADTLDRPIDRPIYISGLARAGSTVLLELISQVPNVGTHRYCDFPFLSIPWLWNKYQQQFSRRPSSISIERPHRDKIQITPESPESMEEPIWQSWFPYIHSTSTVQEISSSKYNARFARFYQEHINKLLLIRNASRYAAKNNYHLTRIDYLFHLFPDARFIIPVRHPIAHVASLIRQHELFCQYAETDARIGPYLQAAGHYEFGPQRVPILMQQSSIQEIQCALDKQSDHSAYAIQWRDVYDKPLKLLARNPGLKKQMMFLRHEDFCSNPHASWQQILALCDLEPNQPPLDHIAAPKHCDQLTDSQKSEIWSITKHIAAPLGYTTQWNS